LEKRRNVETIMTKLSEILKLEFFIFEASKGTKRGKPHLESF